MLARTVDEAWKQFKPQKLTNIWNRWKMVLDLIIDDEGGDRLVESRRGKLYRSPVGKAKDLVTEIEAADEEGESKADAIAAADTDC